jgi:peptidoglycan/LPS O-acetylase OafA/YrhL
LWQYSSNVDFYAAGALGLSLATAVYLLSVPSRWSAWVLATPWMRKIGQASFSIYLMHVLVFYYGAPLLGLQHTVFEPLWLLLGVAAVALPMVVSHWIEMPLQRHTRRWLQAGLERTPLSFKPRSTPA